MLGDFYLQPDAASDEKAARYKWVVRHSILYAAVFYVGAAAIWSLPVALAVSALSVLHFAVGSVKYRYLKSPRHASEAAVYCADQGIHILSFIAMAAVFKYFHFQAALLPAAKSILNLFPNHGGAALSWACIILIIWKPANVTIKKLLSRYKPGGEGEADSTVKNVGALIGTLERLIIALLLSVGQYAAIGLILTAKSVARYDKISKSQSFAEYYLLGTLLSTLLVILAYLVLHR